MIGMSQSCTVYLIKENTMLALGLIRAATGLQSGFIMKCIAIYYIVLDSSVGVFWLIFSHWVQVIVIHCNLMLIYAVPICKNDNNIEKVYCLVSTIKLVIYTAAFY